MKYTIFLVFWVICYPGLATEILVVKQAKQSQIVILDGDISVYTLDHPIKYIDNIIHKVKVNKPLYFLVEYSGGGNEYLFMYLMNSLLEKYSKIIFVINGECSSACTYIAPMAYRVIAVNDVARVRVHRTFVDYEGVIWVNTIQGQANDYSKYGANGNWFLKNKFVFKSDNSLFKLTKDQSIKSGIVDEYIDNIPHQILAKL